MKKFTLKIFCDFDGTVTKNDVWVSSLGKFIHDRKSFDSICKDFESNVITARECILRELELVKDFNFEAFNGFIDNEELDDYFRNFIDFCNNRGFEITLLSEGLDYYIEYFLRKENLELKYFCNTMSAKENGTDKLGRKVYNLSCEFPYSDEHCTWCGMSKRNILINGTNDLADEVSVFIGDGVSDFCVSNYADIVFAKNSLASYCWKNNITYFDFKNFSDVQKKLEKLIESGKIKQKQNARTLRKDVLLGG